jgi:hypothetical protein
MPLEVLAAALDAIISEPAPASSQSSYATRHAWVGLAPISRTPGHAWWAFPDTGSMTLRSLRPFRPTPAHAATDDKDIRIYEQGPSAAHYTNPCLN